MIILSNCNLCADHVTVESVVVTLGFHGHKLGLPPIGSHHENEVKQQVL